MLIDLDLGKAFAVQPEIGRDSPCGIRKGVIPATMTVTAQWLARECPPIGLERHGLPFGKKAAKRCGLIK